MKTDYILDTVGKFCPVPIIETANKMKEVALGKTLTVISDDPGIKNDIRNWCKITGNVFLGENVNENEIEVYERKAVG